MSRLLSSEEAAHALGVTSVTIFRYVDQGRLPAKRIGLRRVIQIEPKDLKAFAEQNGIMCNLPEDSEEDTEE